jgi:prophage antirepressor-like protein
MTTDDVIFEFNEWPIRVRVVAGAPWFRGNDVAAALGYAHPKTALRDHVDAHDKRSLGSLLPPPSDDVAAHFRGAKTPPQEYKSQDMMTPSNSRGDKTSPLKYEAQDVTTSSNKRCELNILAATYINMSGVNALALGSKLEAARAFKHWVTSDVLPAIQRTGKYQRPLVDDVNVHLRLEVAELHTSALTAKLEAAELRAELATLRAASTPQMVTDKLSHTLLLYAPGAPSLGLSDVDRLFVRDRLKNAIAGLSAPCALLAVDATPGAAPKTTDRLLVPLSDSVLKVTGRAFARPDYVPLGKLVAAGYRARHGDVAPPKVERFIDGSTRMVNAYGGDDVAWVEDVVRSYYDTPRPAPSSRKRGGTSAGAPPVKRTNNAAQIAITCYTRAT